MKEIRKKILPPYFQAVIDGRKTFEIRLGGDGVRVGDTLILVEFDPVSGATGRKTRRRVSYVVPMDRETIDSFWSAEDVESRGLVVIGHESERQTSFTLAWRKAALMLRQRCLRLQHRLDTQDQTPGRILADEVERLQEVERRRSTRCTRCWRRYNARKHRDLGTIAHLQAALANANACCNRIQADGNALADQLHAWRQACQDHGIEATPEALRAVLRRGDGRWRPRCWCVGFADEMAGADL